MSGFRSVNQLDVRARVPTNPSSEELTMTTTQDCIAACDACANACDACFAAMAGKESDSDCPACCVSCADICRFCSAELAREARFAEQACRLCAEINAWCAEECRAMGHDHCLRCAEACDRCAEACGAVAA